LLVHCSPWAADGTLYQEPRQEGYREGLDVFGLFCVCRSSHDVCQMFLSSNIKDKCDLSALENSEKEKRTRQNKL
jgi:hypothetical protein